MNPIFARKRPPLPGPSLGNPRPGLARALGRMRRNRLWLLVFLWVAGMVPELVAAFWHGTGPAGLAIAGVGVCARAAGMFLVCTSLPRASWNFRASVVYCAVTVGICAWALYRDGAAWAPLAGGLWLMALPLGALMAYGTQACSFRPLKSWRAHVPMLALWAALQLCSTVLTAQAPAEQDLGAMLNTRRALLTWVQQSGIQTEPTEAETAPALPAVELSTPAAVSGENRLDIDFAALAQSAQGPEAQIHSYFADQAATARNDYTGALAGANLILIRTGQWEFPQELTQRGLWCAGHWGNTWGSGEDFAIVTGSMPQTAEHSDLDLYQPLSLPQQLLHRGYEAYAYCSADGSVLEQLGYECTQTEGLTFFTLVDRTAGDYLGREAFTVYYELASAEDLAAGLELLQQRLASAGQRADTAIVVLGDSGWLTLHSSLAGVVVEAPTGPLDVTPTLMNLLGLEFDSRLYFGRDVLTQGEILVCLGGGSWATAQVCYDGSTRRATSLTGGAVEPEFLQMYRTIAQRRVEIAGQIAALDYWRELFG